LRRFGGVARRERRTAQAQKGKGWHRMSDNGTLSEKQVRAVIVLMESKDVRSAAIQAGISERTLFRWLADDGFRSAMKEAEQEAIAQVVRRLSSLCALALDTLKATMQSKGASASVKVRAADVVLSKVLTFKELKDFDERLTALERGTPQVFDYAAIDRIIAKGGEGEKQKTN